MSPPLHTRTLAGVRVSAYQYRQHGEANTLVPQPPRTNGNKSYHRK